MIVFADRPIGQSIKSSRKAKYLEFRRLKFKKVKKTSSSDLLLISKRIEVMSLHLPLPMC